MRPDIGRYQILSDAEAQAFLKKYEALKAEGLSGYVIAQRFGLTYTGMVARRNSCRKRFLVKHSTSETPKDLVPPKPQDS